MAKVRGSGAITVPIYLDAGTTQQEADNLIRNILMRAGGGRAQARGEVFVGGQPSTDPRPTVEKRQSGEALTRAESQRTIELLDNARLLRVQNKITQGTLDNLIALSTTTGKTAATYRDLQHELRRGVHAQRMVNEENKRAAGRRRTSEREADDRLGMSAKERFMSRQMMGYAGIATALTMPISGFTPLTIGFASMSGVGFGVGAGAAVMVRATLDVTKALNKFQDSLKDMAVAAKAVSDRYEEQDLMMKAQGIGQGFLAAEQSADRLEEWNKKLSESTKSISILNEAWGQFRLDISSLGQTFVTGGAGSRDMWKDLGRILGTVGGVAGRRIGPMIAGGFFDRGTVAFGERRAALEEQLNNLKAGGKFNAAFVGPEQLYQRIQQAAVSRKDKTEEQLKYQIKVWEELVKQSKIAESESDDAKDRLKPTNLLLEAIRDNTMQAFRLIK